MRFDHLCPAGFVAIESHERYVFCQGAAEVCLCSQADIQEIAEVHLTDCNANTDTSLWQTRAREYHDRWRKRQRQNHSHEVSVAVCTVILLSCYIIHEVCAVCRLLDQAISISCCRSNASLLGWQWQLPFQPLFAACSWLYLAVSEFVTEGLYQHIHMFSPLVVICVCVCVCVCV